MLCGIPPSSALATNKLQGSAGTLTATLFFVKNGSINLNELKLPIAFTFVGSLVGSWLILKIDSSTLVKVIPFLLIGIGLYFIFSPTLNDHDRENKLSAISFSVLVCTALGFYDGFFGPGTGSIMALCFLHCLGYGLSKATANAKVLNFVSNISSLFYFILFGDIFWEAGLLMIIGQVIGAQAAAHMIMKKGSKIIKPVVVCVCFFMSVNLFLKSF